MKLYIAFIAAGLALCQPAVLAKKQSPSNVPEAAIHVIHSPELLKCDDTVAVYSPRVKSGKKYKATKNVERDIPTLILLHGWSGSWRDWGKHMDLQALSDRSGFRIICPDGFYDSWYIDKVDHTQMKWRQFFWNEFWPEMDRVYGLKADKTFIDGLSMGGHGAMNIFLDKPELFAGAGSMSGVLTISSSGGSRDKIPVMLGVTDAEDPVCIEQGALYRLERVAQRCEDPFNKIMVVSCGTMDKNFYAVAKEFESRCKELNLFCVTLYSPARHRWPYWTWVIDYHLELFNQKLENSHLGYTQK